ncbi:hypothetical protein CDL12_23578 [Handroanthus impetiginosus]|uniref:Phytosulfokine n=1 Tax=Handroanthus impetiginosus TaxID=429701 RepID=A0A2G9GF25_9LAMI|nr:hypothetical protein CDL12_23578 [Handroanthus impetiginosus]
MAKVSSLPTITLLFFLLLTSNLVLARPDRTFHDITPVDTQVKINEVHVDEDKCGDVGEDECLMRRTLAAHTDYIYTQKQKHP